jgi:hypothetical protein
MSAALTGGCACGAIPHACAAEPIMAGHGHGRSCRSSSGTGPFRDNLGMPER